MKTFDKFCEERQRHYLEHPELPTEASITELEYQQIQLDAAKAGMRFQRLHPTLDETALTLEELEKV